MNFRKNIYYLREFFFPAECGICGTALPDGESALMGLCEGCRSFLSSYMTMYDKCELCGKPLITEKNTCLSCREKEESYKKEYYSKYFLRQIRFFPYTGKFKTLLRAYKFRKSLGIGNFFVQCLAKSLEDLKENQSAECFSGAEWVPVPPRPGKIKTQGWDQLVFLSGLLKKIPNGIPVNACLKRLKSKSQKELNRAERENNLSGRIVCVKKPQKTAVIFDDVITSGATLNVCARTLLEKGTETVYGICLFFD